MQTVCPYKEVTQKENGARRSSISLGKGPQGNSWAPGQRGQRLVMAGGAHCPPIRTGRKTEIIFKCGEVDQLLRVEEFETCVYGASRSYMYSACRCTCTACCAVAHWQCRAVH